MWKYYFGFFFLISQTRNQPYCTHWWSCWYEYFGQFTPDEPTVDWHVRNCSKSIKEALADPGGGPGPPPDPGPSYTVWRPHCKFKSKIINFGAFIFYFSKNFPASLRSPWILYFFHILLVSFCSLFHLLMCILLYYIMCILLHYIDSCHNLSCL